MPLEWPSLRDTPCIWDALQWLIARPNSLLNRRDILVRARLCGLIVSDNGPHWKADGLVANRLAKAALRSLPRDSRKLADILYGLGEIDARATTDLSRILVRHLSVRRPHRPLYGVLVAAAAHEAKRTSKPQLSEIDLAQWVSRAQLSWDTFDRAVQRINHPDILIGAGRYGLKFTARVIAMVDPRAIDTWILRHPNRLRVAIVASAGLPIIYDPDASKRAALLLRSRIPAIQCIAAALHVCPGIPVQELASLRDCHGALATSGIDRADATWMVAYRIKGAVHSRYWTRDRLQGSRTRARNLDANPDSALGGRHNFKAEMCSLKREIETCEQRLSEIDNGLEQMLCDLAAEWPTNGLSNGQMEALDNNFVNTPEIRHRLAEKIVHQGDREWLLRKNIEQLSGLIGLSSDPSEVLDVCFHADDRQFDIAMPWAAQSLILLYVGDGRGVGKRTSDLVVGTSRAFEALAIEPFVAARAPTRWQSSLSRAACAYLFALIVVAAMPEARRQEVEKLNRLVIDHVRILLCAGNPDFRSLQLLFRLITRTVLQMGYCCDSDDIRQNWAGMKELPVFARAMALWSSVALVDQNVALAVSLFKRVAELPLSRGVQGLQMSQMLTLLDLAVATSVRANRSDLVRRVVTMWSEVYLDWQPFFARWAGAAELMAKAVEQDGPERRTFLAEQSLAETHCRQLIEEGKAGLAGIQMLTS